MAHDHRLSARYQTDPRRADLAAALSTAERLALIAAQRGARGDPVAPAVVQAVRAGAGQARARRPPRELARVLDQLDPAGLTQASPPRPVSPLSQRFAAAVSACWSWLAGQSGIRLAWCMAIATAVTAVLHDETHSFWLPLTVAVVVRPEFASVFVRRLNRAVGTAAGALVAAAVLAALHSGWPVAVAAATSLGFAVLAGPRLYALSVVGVTSSALLSACIGRADPVYPVVRLADTLLGCVIALVFGYLLWPGRRSATPAGPSIAAARQAVAGWTLT